MSNENGMENCERQTSFLMKFLWIAEKIPAFKDKKAKEIFSNEKSKRNFIKEINEDEYLELLDGGNKIARDQIKSGWMGRVGMNGIFEGSGGSLKCVPPILEEDKELMIFESLDLAKKMNKENRSLKDIGKVLTLGAYYAHLYEDGNTRTSLLPYFMLTRDFNNKKERRAMKERIIDNEENFIIDFDSLNEIAYGIIEDKIVGEDEYIRDIIKIKNKGKIVHKILSGKEPIIDGSEKDIVSKVIDVDDEYSFLSFLKFFRNNNLDVKDYLNKKGDSLDLKKVAKDFDEDKISEFLKIYRDLKKEMVRVVMDIVVNPNKEEYQVEFMDENIPIADCII